jgi:hemerythrin-like domain-containing protein
MDGGTFCTMYFDEHVTNRPSEICKKKTNKDVPRQEHQFEFKENPTALNIPLEEHRSLREILYFLFEKKEFISDSDFFKNFDIYVKLLEQHNAKEEKCFFRVCELCLSPYELDQICANWIAFAF